MKRIRNFLNGLNEKRLYRIVCFAISMCIILGMYAACACIIEKRNLQSYQVIEDVHVIKYIEDVSIKGDKLEVTGWCLNKNISCANTEVQVFLRNIKDEKDIVWLEVERVNRDDINSYFSCEHDYSQAGFVAYGKAKNLELQEKEYEVFIKITYQAELRENTPAGENVIQREYVKTVSTERYIRRGKLTAFKSDEVMPKRTMSEELNEVFDNGALLVYREDMDIYIYQYGKSLYWVAGQDFEFDKRGLTSMEVGVDTTRIDLLPANWLEQGQEWDSRGFCFEHNEITTAECAPYRVAVSDLPSTYPVLYLWIGHYIDGAQMWLEHLNIDVRTFVNEQ